MKARYYILWALRLIAAFIMLQTLYFKFAGHPESVYIFTTLGAEPWGRIMSGVLELIASILLLVPATIFLGASLAFCIMAGAIASHLLILGIEVMDDGGQLFLYACIVLVANVILLVAYRDQFYRLRSRFGPATKV